MFQSTTVFDMRSMIIDIGDMTCHHDQGVGSDKPVYTRTDFRRYPQSWHRHVIIMEIPVVDLDVCSTESRNLLAEAIIRVQKGTYLQD